MKCKRYNIIIIVINMQIDNEYETKDLTKIKNKLLTTPGTSWRVTSGNILEIQPGIDLKILR